MLLKISIFILLLTPSLELIAQRLPHGTFAISTGYTYTEINFKNNSKFHYKYSSCTGGEEGHGSYSFTNGELLLTFDNPRKKFLPASREISKELSRNDSSSLTFTFYDGRDTSRVQNVIIKYRNKLNGGIYGTVSNNEGIATLKLQNNQLPIEIEVSCFGIEPDTIKFDNSGFYSIRYPLDFSSTKQLVKGKTRKFIVDEFDGDKLVLKPVGEKEFRTFRRPEDQ